MASTEVTSRYLVKFKKRLLERKILIDLMTLVKDRPVINVDTQLSADGIKDALKGLPQTIIINEVNTTYVPGDVYRILRNISGKQSNVGIGFIDSVQADATTTQLGIVLFTQDEIPFNVLDKFTLKKGELENCQDTIETTIGRFIVNYFILVSSFGNKISYVNTKWSMDSINKQISSGMLNKTITKQEYDKFIDSTYFLGHFTELCVPTLTKKSFMTDPNVKKVKEELLKKYKGKLTDPDVIKLIEDTLLAMDKKFLEGDDAKNFYDAIGGKAYNVHRKKLFLAVGGIPSFDDEGGKFDFIENSLQDGWNPDNFANLSNESRKGSFDRGKNTAKGGALTKFIMRVFQDMRIIEEDCGSKKGITITLTGDNISSFMNRYALVNGKIVLLDDKTIGLYSGKTITIRSPQYCKTHNGLCYTCVGDTFRKLSTEALGMLVVDISSTFMYLSMKNMHGTKMEFVNIDPSKHLVVPKS